MKSYIIYDNTRWLKTLFARNMNWQKRTSLNITFERLLRKITNRKGKKPEHLSLGHPHLGKQFKDTS